jgi:hypothetical protein
MSTESQNKKGFTYALGHLRKLTKLRSNRINALQNWVKRIENYCRGNIDRRSYINEVNHCQLQ